MPSGASPGRPGRPSECPSEGHALPSAARAGLARQAGSGAGSSAPKRASPSCEHTRVCHVFNGRGQMGTHRENALSPGRDPRFTGQVGCVCRAEAGHGRWQPRPGSRAQAGRAEGRLSRRGHQRSGAASASDGEARAVTLCAPRSRARLALP